MTRALFLVMLLLAGAGCTATVRGGPLGHQPPPRGGPIFLSTDSPQRPYRTLGFIQITGYGVEVAGLTQVGDAALDYTLRGTLADEAAKLGGDGVIHIAFLDTNPPTPYERATAAVQTAQNLRTGQGGVEQQERTVIVTGEVIRFLDEVAP